MPGMSSGCGNGWHALGCAGCGYDDHGRADVGDVSAWASGMELGSGLGSLIDRLARRDEVSALAVVGQRCRMDAAWVQVRYMAPRAGAVYTRHGTTFGRIRAGGPMACYGHARSTTGSTPCARSAAGRRRSSEAAGTCRAAVEQGRGVPGPGTILADCPGPGSQPISGRPIMEVNGIAAPVAGEPGSRRRTSVARGIAALEAALAQLGELEAAVQVMGEQVTMLEGRRAAVRVPALAAGPDANRRFCGRRAADGSGSRPARMFD